MKIYKMARFQEYNMLYCAECAKNMQQTELIGVAFARHVRVIYFCPDCLAKIRKEIETYEKN